MNNDLDIRDFRKDGLLSDAVIDTKINGKEWYELIGSAVSDNYTKYGIDSAFCGASTSGDVLDVTKKCAVQLGEQICKDTGDSDVCQAVEIGKAVLASTANTDTTSTPQIDTNEVIRNQLKLVLKDFEHTSCESLSEAERVKLTGYLNELEPKFKTAGLQAEFNDTINKLKCNVIAEFRCNDKDTELKVFASHPVCKRKFREVWGKPVAIGCVSGTAVGIGWYNIIKPSAVQSALAGIVSCTMVSYYLKSKKDKE